MKKRMRSICVFCGSSAGSEEVYADSARRLGEYFARNQIRLVFGGGRDGLMGAISKACLEMGGKVVGVIPKELNYREKVALAGCEMLVVDSMHERKQAMYNNSEAFIAMPGGIGTMEETFEVWTWLALGLHKKPLALLNIDNFYQHLLTFISFLEKQKFLSPAHLSLLSVADSIDALMETLDT